VVAENLGQENPLNKEINLVTLYFSEIGRERRRGQWKQEKGERHTCLNILCSIAGSSTHLLLFHTLAATIFSNLVFLVLFRSTSFLEGIKNLTSIYLML
jgi:hypothetical protein